MIEISDSYIFDLKNRSQRTFELIKKKKEKEKRKKNLEFLEKVALCIRFCLTSDQRPRETSNFPSHVIFRISRSLTNPNTRSDDIYLLYVDAHTYTYEL